MIWEERVFEQAGCPVLTPQSYREEILMQPDRDFFLTLVWEQVDFSGSQVKNIASTNVLKSLYFLKRERPELACGVILGQVEALREVFESSGLPQSILHKDGRLYYLHQDAKLITHFLEFMDRYEELALESLYSFPTVPREGYLIYPEYWVKELGRHWKKWGKNTQNWWRKADQENKYAFIWNTFFVWHF
jgi:hypothetical protein